MTIYLLRANSQGEILDASGQVVGRVVPVEPSMEMLRSALDCQDYDPEDPPESEMYCYYRAMLSAATLDLSAAAVKVPERKHYPDINGNNGWAQWNACLDALGVKP